MRRSRTDTHAIQAVEAAAVIPDLSIRLEKAVAQRDEQFRPLIAAAQAAQSPSNADDHSIESLEKRLAEAVSQRDARFAPLIAQAQRNSAK